MLERRTVIDQIEILRDGTVQVRLAKQVVDGEDVLSNEMHRVEPVVPGAELEASLTAVNAQLADLGETEVDETEWDRVRRVVVMEQTEDVIAAYVARHPP